MWKKIKQHFRTYFMTGLLVIVPLAVTYWVVRTLLNWVDDSLYIRHWSPVYIPGLGLLCAILLILLAGILGKNFIGSFFMNTLSDMLNKLPIVGTIYSSLKDVLSTVLSGQEKRFGRAVLIEYPRRDSWTIAFVTNEDVSSTISQHSLDGLTAVYVPTTPNPTSGFLLFLPEKDLHPLNMKVDEALRLVVSLGLAEKHDHGN